MKTVKVKYYTDLDIKSDKLRNVVAHLLGEFGQVEWNIEGEMVRFVKV